MRKAAILGVLVVAVWAMTAARAADERPLPNLLYNSSFEKLVYQPEFGGENLLKIGRGEYTSHFEFWPWKAGMNADTAVAHQGKNSLRVDGPGAGYIHSEVGYYVFETGPGIVLLPETKYVVSGWVQAANVKAGQGGTISLSLGREKITNFAWVASEKWQQLTKEFTTPFNVRGYVNAGLRLDWDLKEGESVWFDDFCLKPAETKKIAKAPAPVISPKGGAYQGPQMISLKTDLPGAVIQYTVDGSEPDRFSVLYKGPFRIDGSVTVRAKVFHTAYTDGAAQASYKLTPLTDRGVPFYPTGWGQDVEKWYAGHVYNPKSKLYFKGKVNSPVQRFDVSELREKYPDSGSLGIAETIKDLPTEGASFWFPADKGPYIINGGVSISRSNLHFISDGAVISFKGRGGFRCASPDSRNWGKTFVLAPLSNFLFSGLVFEGKDGGRSTHSFQGSTEVLFYNCTWRNFADGQKGNIITGNVTTDNIWFVDCTWENNSTGFACYWDGVHNAGVVNGKFIGNRFGGSHWRIWRNNDMSPFNAFQRTGIYVVFDGCQFTGPANGGLTITTANSLVTNCTATGPMDIFLQNDGQGKSNTQPRLIFDATGLKVVNNRVDDCNTFVLLKGHIFQNTRPKALMTTEVRGNQVGRVDNFLAWCPALDPFFPPYARLGELTVRDNVFGGPERPRLMLQTTGNQVKGVAVGKSSVDVDWIDANAVARIDGVTVTKNTFSGNPRPQVVDCEGKELKLKPIVFKGNK